MSKGDSHISSFFIGVLEWTIEVSCFLHHISHRLTAPDSKMAQKFKGENITYVAYSSNMKSYQGLVGAP